MKLVEITKTELQETQRLHWLAKKELRAAKEELAECEKSFASLNRPHDDGEWFHVCGQAADRHAEASRVEAGLREKVNLYAPLKGLTVELLPHGTVRVQVGELEIHVTVPQYADNILLVDACRIGEDTPMVETQFRFPPGHQKPEVEVCPF